MHKCAKNEVAHVIAILFNNRGHVGADQFAMSWYEVFQQNNRDRRCSEPTPSDKRLESINKYIEQLERTGHQCDICITCLIDLMPDITANDDNVLETALKAPFIGTHYTEKSSIVMLYRLIAAKYKKQNIDIDAVLAEFEQRRFDLNIEKTAFEAFAVALKV